MAVVVVGQYYYVVSPYRLYLIDVHRLDRHVRFGPWWLQPRVLQLKPKDYAKSVYKYPSESKEARYRILLIHGSAFESYKALNRAR